MNTNSNHQHSFNSSNFSMLGSSEIETSEFQTSSSEPEMDLEREHPLFI